MNQTQVNDNVPIFIGTAQSFDVTNNQHQHHINHQILFNNVHRQSSSSSSSSLPLYRIQVQENIPINTNIYQIKATDADTGNNARLTYSLYPTNENRLLPIDISPNNGQLYVRDLLDRETLDHYEFLISVTDHGLPKPLNATAIVHITVQDMNDNRPYWKQSKYVFDISEDASVGTLIGQVLAFDMDLGGNASLVYNISQQQQQDSQMFGINPLTGQIYLRSNLDRESKDRYEFNVDVRDQGTIQSLYSEEKAVIIVNVLDINDNRPVFDDDDNDDQSDDGRNILTVPIGTSRKSTIATFRAFDPDLGDNGTVHYSMMDESDLFTIDHLTGALITKTDIKETLKRSTRKISLLATDGQGKKSKVKVINIEIVDKRTLNIDLDYVEQYNFNAKSNEIDYGYRFGSIDLPMKLLQQHQCNNRFFTNFHYQIKNGLPFFVENDDTNEPKLHLMAFDRLNRTDQNEYNLLLCIDWSQCLAATLEITELKSHHHQMIQCDHYVRINVQIESNDDVDCLPLPIENRDLFEVKIPYSPNESFKNHDLLYLNHSNCPLTENIEYELSSPMIDNYALNRMFLIDSNRIVQLKHSHDTTLINQYLHEEFVLSLMAKKHGKVIQSVPIRMKIINSDQSQLGNIAFVNEKFIELEEDCCHVGSPIIQVRINVTHDDFKIRYFIANHGHLSSNDEQFSLNSDNGLLSLKRKFDYETKHEHRINITAVLYSSKSLPISTVSHIIRIRILNTNDEPPIFVRRSYEKEIIENVSPGQLIVQLEAKDSDQQSSNITYLLPKSYRYADYFDLNSDNGELKLMKSLDREQIDHFYVPVYAFDENFKHHTSTLVNVKVVDINDNSPYFVQSNFDIKIPENAKPGTTIYTLVAIDPDLTDRNNRSMDNFGLQYRISSGNVGNKFVLHEQRGELSINAQLDREMQSMYSLIVEVSDSLHTSICNVTIELLDVNDNGPIFEKSDYYAIVNDVSFGWVNVITVRAIDSDSDKLLYRIENDSNNLTRYLSMNSETGEIRLHSSLVIPIFDQLDSNVFTFEVSAVEAGKVAYQSYESKAKVHLTLITNGNHNSLMDSFKLIKYPYMIIVDESRHSIRINQKIGSIEFASYHNYFKHEKSSNLLSYRVLNGGESYRSFNDYFTIQPQTGAILVKRSLNYNYYEAIIEVTKQFDQQKTISTSTLLQIFIGGIDDRKFIQSIHLDSLEVSENQQPGSAIVNLGSFIHNHHPQPYNYQIFYADIDQSHFEIQEKHLKLRKSLDYESQPNRIQVLVFAYRPSDTNLHEHSYLYNLTIHMANVDDNLPQFTQKHYIATISENEQTGSFVAQVNAIDIDDESLIFNKTFGTRRYSYYIVDGNYDMAFSIDNDGVVRTNIVLDREIHDRYQLKVIATEMKQDIFGDFLADEASYQHLTQCIVEIIVIDQNDNVPVFPPYKEISVSEDAEIGSIIATWTANDVDIHPTLSYMKLKTNNDLNEDEDCFEIGLYTGKIYLKCPLKPLLGGTSGPLVRRIKLLLQASDQMHTIETDVTVNVKRNYSKMSPVFRDGANFYQQLDLDDKHSVLMSDINVELFRVQMIEDPIVKRKILFSLNSEAGPEGFYIDQTRGIIYNNRTIRYRRTKFVMLTVFARYRDSDAQAQASLVLNFKHHESIYSRKESSTNSYNLEIESSQIGVSLLRLPRRSYANYVIFNGNSNKNFIILRGRELVLINRPLIDQYLLKIKPIDDKKSTSNSTIIFIHIKVRPSNVKDSTLFSSPFKSQIFELEINENEQIGAEIQNLKTPTPVLRTASQTENGDGFHFRIFSGNDQNLFRVDARTGMLVVDKKLDFETN
ncbi:Cadherin-like protein, partial [Euroglyphus maynei]